MKTIVISKRVSIISTLSLFIGILSLFASCAAKLSPAVSLHSPNNNSIPISVGYYLSGYYFKPDAKIVKGSNAPVNLIIGETLCNGVNTVLQTTFSNVVKLSSLDDDPSLKGIDVIIIPEVINIDLSCPALPGGDEIGLVMIKWTVMDVKKNIIWAKTITGEASKRYPFWRKPREVMELAITDHFQKVLESFFKNDWEKNKDHIVIRPKKHSS